MFTRPPEPASLTITCLTPRSLIFSVTPSPSFVTGTLSSLSLFGPGITSLIFEVGSSWSHSLTFTMSVGWGNVKVNSGPGRSGQSSTTFELPSLDQISSFLLEVAKSGSLLGFDGSRIMAGPHLLVCFRLAASNLMPSPSESFLSTSPCLKLPKSMRARRKPFLQNPLEYQSSASSMSSVDSRATVLVSRACNKQAESSSLAKAGARPKAQAQSNLAIFPKRPRVR
mmetsp:Transcript_37096/g.85752  ORF Transcript_37096/g.85752 Transcript_37096/m.85752 type:complete len:226 (+) Transcript_37096:1036-1713(+)